MKKTIAYLASAGLLSFSMGLVGCGETQGVREEVRATGPDGTTTVTKEVEVKQTGDNPPPTHVETTPAETPPVETPATQP